MTRTLKHGTCGAIPMAASLTPTATLTSSLLLCPFTKLTGLSTVNLQCGAPRRDQITGNQPWHVSGFYPDGSLKPAWMRRLKKVLDAALQLRMVVILGLFYFGQDQRLQDEDAVKRAVVNAVDWLLQQGYRHVLLEIANECDHPGYDHAIIRPRRVAELVRLTKERSGGRLLVSGGF